MNNLIEILPNIYGVKVPKNGLNYILKGNCIWNEQFYEIEADRFLVLPNGNYKLLGFLTKDEISFDASEIVHCYSKPLGLYRNYKADTGYVEHLCNPEQSFRSALPEEIKENEKYLILEKL